MRAVVTTLCLVLTLLPFGREGCLAAGEQTERLPLAKSEVSYVTTDTFYIAAGRNQGLDEGDVIEVVRDGEIIAALKVVGLSSRRASATRLTGEVPIEVGDLVRFVPRWREAELIDPGPIAESLEQNRVKRRKARRSLRDWGFRGRVGLRYLSVNDRTGRSSDFRQPAIDLKLTGTNIAGSGFGLAVDLRTRRTYRHSSDGGSDTADVRRLYRLAGSWDVRNAPLRFTAGRQYAPAFANVSVFDGFLAEWTGDNWGAGVFTGVQPDALDFEFSSEVREHGLFVQRRSAAKARTRWSVSAGAVGSYEAGEINREFVFLQGRYQAKRFFAYLIQEVDYNRGWRREEEGSTLSNTSTYLNLRYRLTDAVDLGAGYDNRRRVRYFRDFVTPETEFDDTYRQGAWGSVSWRFRSRFRLGVSTRFRSGGSSGDSSAHTVTFSARRLTPLDLSVRVRSTAYSNDNSDGWLHSASISSNLTQRLQIALSGGVRSEEPVSSLFQPNEAIWYGLDLSYSLGRRWFWSVSIERTDGDEEENDQIYHSLSYRF